MCIVVIDHWTDKNCGHKLMKREECEINNPLLCDDAGVAQVSFMGKCEMCMTRQRADEAKELKRLGLDKASLTQRSQERRRQIREAIEKGEAAASDNKQSTNVPIAVETSESLAEVKIEKRSQSAEVDLENKPEAKRQRKDETVAVTREPVNPSTVKTEDKVERCNSTSPKKKIIKRGIARKVTSPKKKPQY